MIHLTDSYKVSHWKMLPPGTTNTYCYFEPRKGGRFSHIKYVGLAYVLKKYLTVPVNHNDIDKWKRRFKLHFGTDIFNENDWRIIVNEHKGLLPLEIRTVPEGKIYECGTPLLSVENTDPRLPWLPSYVECLFEQLWYPCSVATISNNVRKIILRGLELTGTENAIDFKLHDFGVRGASSMESAAIGGMAHLTNFKGTDNLPALDLINEYYGCEMAGNSIGASEHSTIIPWKDEKRAYKAILDAYPSGLLACVSDSYDLENAIRGIWGKDLKDKVLKRDGLLIIRPDSGEILDSVRVTLTAIADSFGFYDNNKGYRVLHDKVRMIQGDGCSEETIKEVIDWMIANRWSVDNIAFGMGGGLLQKTNRDDGRFAYKASSSIINGQIVDYCKTPKTDPTKSSKAGRFNLPELAYRNGTIYHNPIWEEMYA